jgi:hypothetical protein
VLCLQEYYSAELTHAFCCHTKQCQLVAQLVHLSVKKALHPEHITLQDQQLEVSNAAADVSVLLREDQGSPRKGAVPAPAGPEAGRQQAGDSDKAKQRQVKQPASMLA